ASLAAPDSIAVAMADAPPDAIAVALVEDATPMAPDDAEPADARIARADARPPRPRDAGVTVAVVDAERAVDAAIAMVAAAALPSDAAPAVGTIVVHSDRWCDVKIDGESRGRAGSGPFEVPVGRHKVLCEQAGTGNHWVRDVDVTPGKRVVVEGTMAAIVDVA